MNAITYKTNESITAKQFSQVFRASGIRRPVDDLPRLQKMLDHGDLLITAWDGEQLVGVARSITDFSYCCYLSDLAVDQNYQSQGIGKELVRQTQLHISEEIALILLSSPIAMEFYPHIGFQKIENGYIIPRKQ
ncbi:GNAT family N-acetyltransferase [Bacillus sp. AGMB 02131]|uniref:GNAT family N-acetyltransferase n=1 Tax=Peribacillus faecalis TaxID=2772559 RepID=A0A927CUK0_9BACI|nr:GNAT family N-acetyltransferase [Peribacillus faecalis]MBD3106992.1 GNAT family N-acetyltransferase [Peribacillus faecalis]